jgi:type I restriction enzyme S subunit
LVPQDPGDESASDLLKRIAAEKLRARKSAAVRTLAALNDGDPFDEPFDIPKSWRWVRFAGIADFSAGRTPSRNDPSFWNNGDHAWISIADIDDGQLLTATKETVSDKARRQIFRSMPEPPGTIVMSFKLTIGKIGRLGIPAFHNEAIISIRPYLASLDAYLFKVLGQFARQGKTKDAIKGATLNRESISKILLPLPPLAEQHRIVAKIHEIMALCDRLETARAQRETRRDRFTTASFARLNSPDREPDIIANQASPALASFKVLTTRRDQIDHLRQAILNLALRGKLVPQDPKDEQASVLLERIAAEGRQLVKAGEKQRTGPTKTIGEKDLPFPMPSGWEAKRLAAISRRIHYGFTASADQTLQGVRLLRITDIQDNAVDWPSVPGCVIGKGELDRYILQRGDILVARTGGTIGKTFLVRDVPVTAVFASYLIRVQASKHLFDEFLKLFFESPIYWAQLREGTRGTGQPNVNGQTLGNLIVPIPPVAEQRRIVDKAKGLLTFCDRLEASLAAIDERRRRLLAALIAEVLPPSQSEGS